MGRLPGFTEPRIGVEVGGGVSIAREHSVQSHNPRNKGEKRVAEDPNPGRPFSRSKQKRWDGGILILHCVCVRGGGVM